jgi:hypothetical protein
MKEADSCHLKFSIEHSEPRQKLNLKSIEADWLLLIIQSRKSILYHVYPFDLGVIMPGYTYSFIMFF